MKENIQTLKNTKIYKQVETGDNQTNKRTNRNWNNRQKDSNRSGNNRQTDKQTNRQLSKKETNTSWKIRQTKKINKQKKQVKLSTGGLSEATIIFEWKFFNRIASALNLIELNWWMGRMERSLNRMLIGKNLICQRKLLILYF